MFFMKKIITPILFAVLLSFVSQISYANRAPDETGPMLDSAESLFKVMKAGEYKSIWQFLSGKSSL
jgi:hypothetical protein